MTVLVYGRTSCSLCRQAKEKLDLLGLKYEEYDLDEAISFRSSGGDLPDIPWKVVELRAMFASINDRVPMIIIDGTAFDYPGAMRFLKRKGGE